MTIRFHSFPSAQQAARALAEAVAQDLRRTLGQRGEAVLAVSGGRSPVAFFHALSQSDLDWGKVGVTLADERVVPTAIPRWCGKTCCKTAPPPHGGFP